MISVIHILSSLKLGGAERLTIELVKVQLSQSVDAKIYSLGSNTDFLVEEVAAQGIPFGCSGKGSSRFSRYRAIINAIESYDVVHIHSPRTLASLTPLLHRIKKKRIIYTRHGLDPLSSLKWKAIHFIWRKHIHFVSFVTQAGYDVFIKNHKWDRQKLLVITNGVKVPDEPIKEVSSNIRFGSVGRMVDLKRQDLLLNAIGNLETSRGGEANFVLHFFGSGPLEEELKESARGLRKGTVEFHGEVSNVDAIYNSIDVLVVSSESEGLSMVIIEAMARGVPAIATDVGGNSTLVIDNETGILVPFGLASDISSAMERLIDNPDLIKSFGIKAKQLIESKYSIEKTSEKYFECYQS